METRPLPPEDARVSPEHPSGSPASGSGDLGRVLRSGPFRLLLTAQFTSNLGDWLAFMALFSLAAFDWQVDVLQVGFLALAYMLPFATVAPVAGVFVDRWELRRVLIASDLARAGIVGLMAISTQLWQMCLLLFLLQSVSAFFNPAQHAAIPRLVQRRHILAANALNTQAAHFTKILGPGVAGILVASLGVHGCFLVDGITFLLSAALLSRLPAMHTAPRAAAGPTGWWYDLRSGIRHLRDARRARAAILTVATSICALGAFTVVLPVYARDQLGAGARLMGFLLSGMGVGAVLGAFGVTHTGSRWDRLLTISLGAGVSGVALTLLAGVPAVGAGLAATILLGVGIAGLLVPAYALLQEETPPELLGRTVSLGVTFIALSQVLGMALASLGAAYFGPRTLLGLLAGGLLLAWMVLLAQVIYLRWAARRRVPADRDRDT